MRRMIWLSIPFSAVSVETGLKSLFQNALHPGEAWQLLQGIRVQLSDYYKRAFSLGVRIRTIARRIREPVMHLVAVAAFKVVQ
jgi:hypothetical protein